MRTPKKGHLFLQEGQNKRVCYDKDIRQKGTQEFLVSRLFVAATTNCRTMARDLSIQVQWILQLHDIVQSFIASSSLQSKQDGTKQQFPRSDEVRTDF